MKKLVNFIISGIVDNPDKLTVNESVSKEDNLITLDIKTDPKDMGKVIGKKGKIIKAIRNLVKVKALKEGKKVILNID